MSNQKIAGMQMKNLLLFQLKNEARRTIYDLYRGAFHGSKSYQFIFILSHMRSGSSLLTKIVSNNPEVNGFGEANFRYLAPRDYGSSIGKILYVNRRSKKNGQGQYILDKLLFNYLLPLESIDLLLAKNVRVIFLIREPKESIASMINTMKMSAEESYNYYIDRLAILERYAEIISENSQAVMVTYEQILRQTDVVFKLLQGYLGLSVPLQEEYELTTRPDYGGDPSPNLASGRILRDIPKQVLVQFPEEWLQKAQNSYIHCSQVLRHHCTYLDDDAIVNARRISSR
jgi:hypothetical protein